jgi:hypothetical protein
MEEEQQCSNEGTNPRQHQYCFQAGLSQCHQLSSIPFHPSGWNEWSIVIDTGVIVVVTILAYGFKAVCELATTSITDNWTLFGLVCHSVINFPLSHFTLLGGMSGVSLLTLM